MQIHLRAPAIAQSKTDNAGEKERVKKRCRKIDAWHPVFRTSLLSYFNALRFVVTPYQQIPN
jgi:hypothetical protein